MDVSAHLTVIGKKKKEKENSRLRAVPSIMLKRVVVGGESSCWCGAFPEARLVDQIPGDLIAVYLTFIW